MALAQADLDKLETALASGQLTVDYDGRRVTFRSVAELRSAIDYVKAELAAAGGSARTTQSFAAHSRT